MPDGLQEVGPRAEQNLALQTTEVSWQPEGALEYEDWYMIGRTLQVIGKAMPWWLGDWMNYGDRTYGETYSQAISETGIPLETLKKYKAVATRVARERRKSTLTWSHHFAIAYLEAAEGDRILAIAEEFGLSVRDVKLVTALPNKIPLFDFVANNIQLRYPEVIAEVQRLNMLALPVTVDAPSNGAGGARNDDNAESGPTYDPVAEDGVAWLDGTGSDPVDQFFAEKGVPILFSDATQVVWQGGIRLYVQQNGDETHLVWERRIT